MRAGGQRMGLWGLGLRFLLVAPLVAFLLAAMAVTIDGLSDSIRAVDVVVVPGNTVNRDGSLSPRLKARLDVALDLYRRGLCSAVFVSGAVGVEGVDEASAMETYLLRHGVRSQDVVRDSRGTNTDATARHAAEFMRQRGFRSAIAASQFFHITRLRHLLSRHGVRVLGTAHARYLEPRDAYSLAREVVALTVLLLRPTSTD